MQKYEISLLRVAAKTFEESAPALETEGRKAEAKLHHLNAKLLRDKLAQAPKN